MAKKKNPMHLFFGTQRETDVPFKSELKQLEENGRCVVRTDTFCLSSSSHALLSAALSSIQPILADQRHNTCKTALQRKLKQ